ncbi:TadE family protein [Streptomyces sp. NPDC059009]|uniref:TadE family protein n=1 Tax=Streptomyces sp. NPDC059009 TaxID=3346694 RepID=UPI0036B2F957
MSARRPGADSESGSAALELVLVVPALISMLWFLVFCGRMADARLRVEDAAHQAARAASLERTSSAAAGQARATARAALHDAGVTCQSLDATTSGSIRAGGTVTALVTCRVGLHDMALLQVPGSTTLSATASAPVDEFRGTGETP